MTIQIIHDWDFPINKRATNLKTAFWLVADSFLGRFKWFQKLIPDFVKNQKLSCALALLAMDKLFDVRAVWGLTKEVIDRYPDFFQLLCNEHYDVRFHYHEHYSKVGKGRWVPIVNLPKENMVYDRRYSSGLTVLPANGESVVWHCDHPNNLAYYLEFLVRCEAEGLL